MTDKIKDNIEELNEKKDQPKENPEPPKEEGGQPKKYPQPEFDPRLAMAAYAGPAMMVYGGPDYFKYNNGMRLDGMAQAFSMNAQPSAELPDKTPNFCPECGSVLYKNANFCQNCGTRVKKEEEAPK